MVLMSAGKNARNVSSLVNQCQGGGNKLAGLAPSVGVPIPANIASRNRTAPNTVTYLANDILTKLTPTNKNCASAGCKCDHTLVSNVCQNNTRCNQAFPKNVHQANSGVHANRWRSSGMYVKSM